MLDVLKELITNLINILGIPVNSYLKSFLSAKRMNNRKMVMLNLEPSSFCMDSTFLYTLTSEIILGVCGIIALYIYNMIQKIIIFKEDFFLIKLCSIAFFIAISLIVLSRHKFMYGIRIGEIAKGEKEITYKFKGYTYAFINFMVIFFAYLIMLIFIFFDISVLIETKIYYMMILALLFVVFINMLVCIAFKNRRVEVSVSKTAKLEICLSDGRKRNYDLFEKSFRMVDLRIRFDKDIVINDLRSGECDWYCRNDITEILLEDHKFIFLNGEWVKTV